MNRYGIQKMKCGNMVFTPLMESHIRTFSPACGKNVGRGSLNRGAVIQDPATLVETTLEKLARGVTHTSRIGRTIVN